jgi:hypothetical protein
MATKESNKIERGMMVSAAREHELKNRPGGSNVGEYANVSPDNFAGNACGLPGAYPIDTMERARAALAYAHNAKDPECIKRQVYKKWPSLKPDNE